MKKLLIITDAWHPQVNGVVRTFEALQNQLLKQGYEVVLIHPGLGRTLALPFYKEIELALFPSRTIRKEFAKHAPDAVHIATEGPLGLAGRRYCVRSQILFTTSYHTQFHLHAVAWFGALAYRPAYAFIKWFHKKAERVMVATPDLKKELEDAGVKRVVVWPLGVDTDLFVRNPAPPHVALPKPVFVYLGRLAPEKNIQEFLNADLPGTKLVIGDGPLRKSLEHQYGERVTFVGYKHGRELVDWLSMTDVLVFPSKSETFGLVILEALSCGVPVAAHNVRGPKDILTNGVDGYLDDDIGKAAKQCLALKGEGCRTTALRYSWDRSANAFIGHLASPARTSA